MADQGIAQKDTYFVAVKLFLERDGKLFIFKDRFGAWDIPGGRIKKHEFATPIPEVIARKMAEEVGPQVQYEVAAHPEILMRHERVESSEGNPIVRIFGLGYIAEWKSGEPQLSEAHTELLWVEPTSFKPEDYFTGGWLKGVEEYLKIRNK